MPAKIIIIKLFIYSVSKITQIYATRAEAVAESL